MEPTLTLIIAIVAAVGGAHQAWLRYRLAKQVSDLQSRQVEIASEAALGKRMDDRVAHEIARLDAMVAELQARVAHLEKVAAEHEQAKIYMAMHGLRWPPEVPDESKTG